MAGGAGSGGDRLQPSGPQKLPSLAGTRQLADVPEAGTGVWPWGEGRSLVSCPAPPGDISIVPALQISVPLGSLSKTCFPRKQNFVKLSLIKNHLIFLP